jgi:integrase
MATGKITLAAINGLDGWLWDSVVGGLGVRKQKRNIFYYLRYRFQGHQIVKSLGRHGSPWTPDLARNKARELLGVLATGTDPFAIPLASEGFGAEVERYLAKKQSTLKPRSYVEAVRYLRKHAAPLHKLTLAEVDRRSIAVLLGQVETASGPFARNRTRSNLSAFFAWAIQEGLTETNPVQGTGTAEEGPSRDRVLTTDELRALWLAVEPPFADVVKLLLLTGTRREEIGGLRWAEVDLTHKLIVLPPARTKNSRGHSLPLSNQAAAIITARPRQGDFVFGAKGFQDWHRLKAKLDARLGIAPWRLHDLRRTAATYMGELGIQPHHIESVLNHYSGHRSGVAGVYQRAKYTDEMRVALQRWADHLDRITA